MLFYKKDKPPSVTNIMIGICVAGIIGGLLGEVKYSSQAKNCLSDDRCWIVSSQTRRNKAIETGAMCGFFVSTMLNISAIARSD